MKNVHRINQHIYITSDEKIKERDYFISKEGTIHDEFGGGFGDKKVILTTDQDLINNGVQAISNEFLEWFVKNPTCEEVVVDLVPINEFGSEITVGAYGFDKFEYKIIIPQEEAKQRAANYMALKGALDVKEETLEEAALKETKAYGYGKYQTTSERYVIRQAFINGAKWQEERMYSEEDMRNAFDSAREFNSLDGVVDVHIVLPMGGDVSDLQPLHFTFEEWFEQEFVPSFAYSNDDPFKYESAARRAWEASRDELYNG